ncbi:MAG: hypothetical protein FWF29_00345 [Treponema sp.]|nr:hypothetical protein [Treponema sp.]
MARKAKAVYAPGELSRVRGKLGELDANEAKRMVEVLGGEVGYERTADQEAQRQKPKTRRETVELVVQGHGSSRRPRRRIDMTGMDNADAGVFVHRTSKKKNADPSDDPSVQLKTPYLERVKMDRYASLPEFDIKTSTQVLVSAIMIFSDPPDYVSPLFVTRRLNEYYKYIEQLVTSTRTLFPRNNARRSERVKKASPFVFSILDTIRYINIERITADLARIQSHPRTVKVSDLADILRSVYKPLFILEKLDTTTHIKEAYKFLYKALYIENPDEAKTKYQQHIKTALSSFNKIRNDIHYLLYPLLVKLLSDRWLPYETFFSERHRRFMNFLKTAEHEQISLPAENTQPSGSAGIESVHEDIKNELASEVTEADFSIEPEEDPDDPKVLERKEREAARESEQKFVDKGFEAMELLFPRAGWDRLGSFPDFYPYFSDTLELKRGYELIAPTDPLQQVAVLMHIIEEFFFALRYVSFGSIVGSDNNLVRVDDYLGSIINNWQRYIDDSFDKEYIPRLTELCQMLEQSSDARNSTYGRRIINELNWVKRLNYLPYYKFESLGPPPFHKRDITPIYSEIKLLRKYLTAVAAGIEQGNRQGGAEASAPCDGIDNPWEPYNFEVPNPISIRLDSLLSPKKRNNAALVFFCLSAVVILDHLVNDETSWAYDNRSGPLFRSVDGAGNIPLFSVETKLDADMIFKLTLKQRRQEKEMQEKSAQEK